MQSSGEDFSASPHRHGRAAPLHLNVPLAPRHTESQKTTNNSSFSGRAPEDTQESSGRPGRSVSPRIHRRGSPLRRACTNKIRYTLEDEGEPCFSASPHRHRRASPLRHVCPQTVSTKPRVKNTPSILPFIAVHKRAKPP